MSGLGLSLGLNRGAFKPFNILDLNPLVYFDAASSMLDADGNQAGFLEKVKTLKNLVDGGYDGNENDPLRRPRALPLIDGKGYLYTSGVADNYADFDEPIIPSSGDFDLSVKFVAGRVSGYQALLSQFGSYVDGRLLLRVDPNGNLTFFVGGGASLTVTGGTVTAGTVHTARVTRTGNDCVLYLDGTSVGSGTFSVGPLQTNTRIGEGGVTTNHEFRGAIMSVKVDDDVICDFTDTSVDHGSTSFACETGQTVTINRASFDAALLLRRPVLRFDGASSSEGDKMYFRISDDEQGTVHTFTKAAVVNASGDNYNTTGPPVLSLYKDGQNAWSGNGAIPVAGYQHPSNIMRVSYATFSSRLRHYNAFGDQYGTQVFESSLGPTSQYSKFNNGNLQTRTDVADIKVQNGRLAHSSQTNAGSCPMDFETLIMFNYALGAADAQKVYDTIKVVPSYDSDASAYMSLLESDGVNLSEAKKDAINTFYQKGKNAGWYSSLKRFYLPVWGSAAPNARCLVSNTSGTFIGSITHGSGFAHPTTASSSNRFNLNYSLLDDLTTEDFCLMALAYDDTEPRDRAIPINHTIIGSGPTSGTSIRVSASSSSAKPIAICLGVNADEGLIGTHGVLLTNRLGGDTSLTTLDATTPTDTSTTGSLTGSYGNFPISGFGSTVNASGVTTGATDAKAGAFGISGGLTESQRSSYALAVRHLWEECSGLTL